MTIQDRMESGSFLKPRIPATLSRKIMTNLLRETMDFDGLIISDDLEMEEIAKERGLPKGAADKRVSSKAVKEYFGHKQA